MRLDEYQIANALIDTRLVMTSRHGITFAVTRSVPVRMGRPMGVCEDSSFLVREKTRARYSSHRVFSTCAVSSREVKNSTSPSLAPSDGCAKIPWFLLTRRYPWRLLQGSSDIISDFELCP
jgi:hypothetical protein